MWYQHLVMSKREDMLLILSNRKNEDKSLEALGLVLSRTKRKLAQPHKESRICTALGDALLVSPTVLVSEADMLVL